MYWQRLTPGLRCLCARRTMSSAAKPLEATQWPNPIYASERITDRKSIFCAHATKITSMSDVPTFLEILSRSPSLKRSTHMMYAFRMANGKMSGEHDGGENGSGSRLARLLHLSDCNDVIVVVSRWYGGVQLGSSRWRNISEVAKDALKQGGFLMPKVSERTRKTRSP